MNALLPLYSTVPESIGKAAMAAMVAMVATETQLVQNNSLYKKMRDEKMFNFAPHSI